MKQSVLPYEHSHHLFKHGGVPRSRYDLVGRKRRSLIRVESVDMEEDNGAVAAAAEVAAAAVVVLSCRSRL